jgi:uncharacterized membrane protein YcaP (DUF421 family)
VDWIIGNWAQLGAAAGKAALMYGVALLGLRLGERRTLAQWSLIDFVTAVAVGAIVGRTAIAGRQSFVTGAAALLTLLALHRLASLARFRQGPRKLLDHRVRVLAHDGKLRPDQLRRCGLTPADVHAHLRQRGVFDLAELRYLLYETKGGLTVVRYDDDAQAPLIRDAIDHSAGSPG